MFQILAMGPPPNPNQPPAVQFISSILPFLLIFVVFYFMLIRPQQKKQKEMQRMIESLKSGDKIVTNGGILGTVTNVKDKTVIVRIADNVKIEILRSAVQTVTQRAADDDTAGGKN
jgi:preprotein translocase subunit YajC